MFEGTLRMEIHHPDGTVTRHVARNTLTDEFKEFAAKKLAGDSTETRVLDASNWAFVHNATGTGTPPAIVAADDQATPMVSFSGGEITVTAEVTYDDFVDDLSARTFALDWGSTPERFAYLSGTNWSPAPTTVAAGGIINYTWTITPSLTNADQRQAYQAYVEPVAAADLDLASEFALGSLVIGVMRGNTTAPTTLEASVYRWDGTAGGGFSDETGPYPIEKVGSDVTSGTVVLTGTVLKYTFAIPVWDLQNGQPLSLDPLVVVHWSSNNLALFGWARHVSMPSGSENLPVTITL